MPSFKPCSTTKPPALPSPLDRGASDTLQEGHELLPGAFPDRDHWTITHVGRKGDLTVRHTRSHYTVRLPADYVRESTGLGYATTIHAAQGVTADTMHGLATGLSHANSCTPCSPETGRQPPLPPSRRRRRSAQHHPARDRRTRHPDRDPATDPRPRRHANLSHHTAARTQRPSRPAPRCRSALHRPGSMSRPSSWLAPRSFRCSTAKPTRSSRNSPASRPGRPSEHTCSRWRLKPVSTHSSTYREPRDSGASAYRSPPATYVADAALVRLVPHSLAAGVREHHSSLSPGVAPKSSRCHPSSRGPCGSE